MIHSLTASYTDLYQLTMAQVYFKTKPDSIAVFDYYFRSNPFDGGYTVFAGLDTILDILENFKFSESDIDYLKSHGFESSFLEYLKNFRFRGSVFSSREGDLIFPDRPVLQVEANILEAQIIETVLLNILNFQTLIATKARRIRQSAGDKILLDMGLRRAHATGGYFASRAAVIGGFDSTSNVIAAEDFDIPCSGTMAHSLIQSYEDELQAFRDFAQIRPEQCVLLVDTYNTLKSGLPHAIQVAKEMEKRGDKLYGIRLDSGDLAYLAKESRRILDEENLGYVKIVASNQLDEYVIKSLKDQRAPIDIFGVGTSLVTGKPDASLDGVYKLSEYNGEPRFKLSDNIIKISFPSKKQVFRVLDEDGKFYGADAVGTFGEGKPSMMFHPFDNTKKLNLEKFTQIPLLNPVMEQGRRVIPRKTVAEIAAFSQSQIDLLPDEYKRFQNPHSYKIGLSQKLKSIRDALIEAHRS